MPIVDRLPKRKHSFNIPKIPQNVHPIVKETLELVIKSGVTREIIGEAAGLGGNTITHWHTHSPGLASVSHVLEVLGYKLKIVKIGSDDG